MPCTLCDVTSSSFASALKEAMTAARVDAQALARRTGIGTSTVYAYLGGTRKPTAKSIDKIADELRVDGAMRRRMYAAIDATPDDADLADTAADLIRSLPSTLDRRLAVELLRTQLRVAQESPPHATVEAGARGTVTSLANRQTPVPESPPPPGPRGK